MKKLIILTQRKHPRELSFKITFILSPLMVLKKMVLGLTFFSYDVDDAQKLDCLYIPGQIIHLPLYPDIKWQTVMIIAKGRIYIKIY